MRNLSLGATLARRSLLPWVALASMLFFGCASARERFPALERLPSLTPASRPAWLRLPDISLAWLRPPDISLAWPGTPPRGEIHGKILGSPTERESGEAEPPRVVIYLEPIGSGGGSGTRGSATIRQRERRFSPAFLVVPAGESVIFVNEDEIFHRIFSYSEPNAFDLQTLTRGESGEVTLASPGAVRFYCGLHPAESGTIFVTPSPYFATADARGDYQIAGVPPGQYRLHTWSEGLHTWSERSASNSHDVTVRAGASSSVDVALQGH